MAVPAVTGFSVRIAGEAAGDAGPEPVRVGSGRPVPLSLTGGRLHWSGWVLTSAGAAGAPAAGATTGSPASGLTGADGSPAALVATADGVTVLLAGELYHTDALREAVGGTADGARTDAELLLACWLRYGTPGLRLLDGRFAAVVTEGGAAVLATDHAGSVPLYLRRDRGSVEVATEAKMLAGAAPFTHAGAEPTPGTAPVPGSAAVRRVCAGTAVTVVPGADMARAMPTWRPPEHRLVLPEREAVDRVARTLDAAVRARLGGGGPVTVVLSGGIDSSTVAALATRAGAEVHTVSLGTDAGDEFAAARLVAAHLGTAHEEYTVSGEDLVRSLPFVVAAAEIADPDVLEYLLPLVVLYGQLHTGGRRILTGYGADIPLGGMHRATHRLDSLDDVIAADMATFDGLNELSPVLGGLTGHWTTHPFWDRAVLDTLTALEPGLKRRHGLDKWVLREAMRDLLPHATVSRPKLGIHEGSGTTSTWTALLLRAGVAEADVPAAKRAMAAAIHRRVVVLAEPAADVSFDALLADLAGGRTLEVTLP